MRHELRSPPTEILERPRCSLRPEPAGRTRTAGSSGRQIRRSRSGIAAELDDSAKRMEREIVSGMFKRERRLADHRRRCRRVWRGRAATDGGASFPVTHGRQVARSNLVEEEKGMNRKSFDALTRRASMPTLGAASLAAFARPSVASAKKNDSKFKKCKKQVDECTVRMLLDCSGNTAQRLAKAACCDQLKQCKFDEFIFCASAVAGLP
jgi:hypothetical protein